MERCDIIIPVWNEKELTQRCIDRIKKHTKYPFRLIIIDNGSDKKTKEYLENEKEKLSSQFILLRNDRNLGFVKAVNQGFGKADSPYICVLNNDTLVCENWLTNMIDLFRKNNDIGIINPSSNVLGQHANPEKIDSFAASLEAEKGLYQKMDFCRGFCMLFKKSLLDKAGPFDEIFDMGYFEEADFCKRAKQQGCICVRSKSSYVYHADRASFRDIKNLNDLFEKNKIIFYKRWGRPLRIAAVIENTDSLNSYVRVINNLLDKGHDVLVLCKKGIRINGIEDHINLKFKDIGWPFFFSFFYKIIERKKKKKIKAILADNGKRNILENTRFIHKAEIFKKNESKSLMDFCQKFSFDENYIREKD